MTGIDAWANGSPIRNLANFQISEATTPLALDDTSGDVGTFSLAFASKVTPAEVKQIRGQTIELTDDRQGRFVGVAETASGSRNAPVLAGANDLVRLSVTRTADPFVGTLGEAVHYYCELCGVSGGISIDPAVAATNVTLLGWRDNVWIRLKSLAARYRFEIALVGEALTFRTPRQITARDDNDASPVAWSASDVNLASAIVVNYWNLQAVTEGQVWPPVTKDPNDAYGAGSELITVGANEQVTVVLQLSASVSHIDQPEYVGEEFDADLLQRSAYVVADGTNHVLKSEFWETVGGWMTVQIGQEDADGNWVNDTRTVTVTVQGPNAMQTSGPFTVGFPTDRQNFEQGLFLTGTGVTFDKKEVRIQTGVSPDRAQQDVGATIEADCISTLADAYEAASHVLGNYMGSQHSISGTSTLLNRGKGVRPIFTFADFDAQYAGLTTFGSFDAKVGRLKFGQFDAGILRAQEGEFERQAFGNVGGARRYFDGAYYRIRSASYGRDTVQFSATMDTLFADFDAVWAGKKFSDFDAAWNGATFDDFSSSPLAPGRPGGADTLSPGYLGGASAVLETRLYPARAATMQCVVRYGNEFYLSQVTTADADSGEETTTISRLRTDGTLKDSMVLRNAGHGTSFVLEWDGRTMWVWLTWAQAASTGRHDIVRFPYKAGSFTRSQIGAQTILAGNGTYRTIQFDWTNGWALVRTAINATSERFDRVKIADLKAGRLTPTSGSVTLPVGPPTIQGFFTLGNSFFRYVGSGGGTGTPADDPSVLTEYDWATGAVLNEVDTDDLGRNKDGTYPGDHHEPESATLHRTGTGMNIGYIGVVVNTNPNYEYQLWRYILAKGR